MTKSPTFESWTAMKTRCLNPSASNYMNYGGRGIEICNRWLKFENFIYDMGQRPQGTTLDRIDSNGNYYPMNCRWATPTEQARNRRATNLITHNGEQKCLSAWAEKLGIEPFALRLRIKKWGLEAALEKEPRANKRRAA